MEQLEIFNCVQGHLFTDILGHERLGRLWVTQGWVFGENPSGECDSGVCFHKKTIKNLILQGHVREFTETIRKRILNNRKSWRSSLGEISGLC